MGQVMVWAARREVVLMVAAWVAATTLGACTRADEGHEGFNAEEWAVVQTLSPLPDVDGCPPGFSAADGCDRLARFGQRLYCSPGYSGPLLAANPNGQEGEIGKVSCATCHDPEHWFADRGDRKASFGTGETKRNTPTLINVAYSRSFMWTSRYTSLTTSFHLPLTAPTVLNSSADRLAGFLNGGDPALGTEFAALFGAPPSVDNVEHNAGLALEAYLRRLISRDAPFDRYVAGEREAISEQARRGLRLFIGDAICIECHHGPHFDDERMRVAGVPREDGAPEDHGAYDNGSDAGGGDEAFRDLFRTPSLRSVAETAPYMHRGQLATLHDVLRFYDAGPQAPVPERIDPNLQPLALGEAQLDDLEAFLRTLSGEPVPAPWDACP
jgi:cytochrome c peroxidase